MHIVLSDFQIQCPVPCAHGYMIDENGCTTCDCTSPPDADVMCSSTQQCNMYCPHGYRSDENSCKVRAPDVFLLH